MRETKEREKNVFERIQYRESRERKRLKGFNWKKGVKESDWKDLVEWKEERKVFLKDSIERKEHKCLKGFNWEKAEKGRKC